MLPAGFEPAIPASERPQNHALDHAATEPITISFFFSYLQSLTNWNEISSTRRKVLTGLLLRQQPYRI